MAEPLPAPGRSFPDAVAVEGPVLVGEGKVEKGVPGGVNGPRPLNGEVGAALRREKGPHFLGAAVEHPPDGIAGKVGGGLQDRAAFQN